MKKLVLIAIVMTLSSVLVHAYDYEEQRRLQARDSGKLFTEPKKKETLSKGQKKQKVVQHRKNLEKRRANRIMGIKNNQGDVINAR